MENNNLRPISPVANGAPRPNQPPTPLFADVARTPIAPTPPPVPLVSSSITPLSPAQVTPLPAATPPIPAPQPTSLGARPNPQPTRNWKQTFTRGGITLLILLLIGAGTLFFINLRERPDSQQLSNEINNTTIPLSEFADSGSLNLLGGQSLIVNGQLRANESFVLAPQTEPTTGERGQIYYDSSSNQLAYYNGSQFVRLPGDNFVQSFQGQSGNVTLTAGNGMTITGTTVTNDGVTSIGGTNGDITLGSGLAIIGQSLQATGVQNLTSGSVGLTVTNDGAGNLTITSSGAGTGTVTSGGGTGGTIPMFTAAQNIENSVITQSGGAITVGGNLSVTGALTLATPLSVANGGTGATSLTANGVIVGNGTSALTSVTAGGAGLCLMSTGGAPAFSACPGGGGVTSLNGLNGILTIANASGGGSTITIDNASTAAKGIAQFDATNFTASSGLINTIQNINTGASPTFTNMTLSGDLGVNGGDITSSGGLNITPGGTLIIGATAQTLTLQGNASTTLSATNGANTTTLNFQSPTATVTYRLPTAAAGTYDVCSTAGNCAGVGGGVTTAGGTINRLAKFTAAQGIGDSTITDNGTSVTTSVDLIIQGGDVTVGVANTQVGTINFAHSGSGFLGSITQGALTNNRTYTLPDANGTFCLTTGNCTGSGSNSTLQAAYDAGNSITTSNSRDLDIILANTTVDSNFDLVIADGSTSTVSFSRANGAGTADPSQILLIDNQDTDRAVAAGIKLQAAAGGLTMAIDATDAEIGVALAAGDNTITGTNFSLDGNAGTFALTGTGSTTFTTPVGSVINTKVTIPVYNPGASGQIVSMGLTSAAPSTARAISIFDARTSTHQPTIAVFSPDESSAVGFTWNGSNANVNVQTTDNASGSTKAITLQSGTANATSGDVTIISGAGSGANSSTGSVGIDSGAKTGAGTAGVVTIGGTNASAINLGYTSGTTNVLTTIRGKTLIRPRADTTAVLQVQDAGGTEFFSVDSNTANVVLGKPSVATGRLVFHGSASANAITLTAPNNATTNTVTLPNETGTICLQNSANCGFATTSTAFVQNGNSFTGLATLGTNDAFDLAIERGGTTQLTVGNGTVTFASNVDLILQGTTAYISNPQAASSENEVFGLNATSTGLRSVTLGNGATTGSTNNSIAIGRSASATAGGNSIAIGEVASCSSSGCIAIGQGTVAGFSSTALGRSASATNQESVAIGNSALIGGVESIALGAGATTTAANQMVVGSTSAAITQLVLGNGVTNATPTGILIQGTSGTGTNIAGASLTIAGGASTGSAAGGSINLQISNPGSSGTGTNALTTVASLSGTNGAATFQNSANSANAFRVLTTAASGSGETLGIDTTESIFRILANNTGHLNSSNGTTWNSGTVLPSPARCCVGAVAVNGYLYSLGGDDGGGKLTSVLYARIASDGSIGAWNTTTSLPTGMAGGGNATTYNGYIYITGGTSTAATAQDVFYAKPNPDGTITSWITQDNPTGNIDHQNAGVAAYNGYLYITGGSQIDGTLLDDVYYARIQADGSVPSFSVMTNWLPTSESNPGQAIIANGYLYVLGSSNFNKFYYGRLIGNGTAVAADGTTVVGTLASNVLAESSRKYGALSVMNGYMYAIGGGTDGLATVEYAPIASNGDLGAFTIDSTALPAARTICPGTAPAVNGYMYLYGCGDGNFNPTNSVYYASGSRVKVGAGLDLVGYSGEDITGGGMGGSLTAGNTLVSGTLSVTGNTNLRDGAVVGNNFTVNGLTSLQTTTNSTTGFQILNASGTPQFVVDTTNARTYIGNPTADSTGALLVLDTKNSAGDPSTTGLTGGAMYYNSNSNTFRCYENSAWYDCVSRHKIVLGADVADSSGACTNADITGLSFSVSSGQVYRFHALIEFTAASTNTGAQWTATAPTNNFFSIKTQHPTSASSNDVANVNVSDGGNCSATTFDTTGNLATIDGMVAPTAGGTLQLRMATEVDTSAITVKAGSTLEWW